MTMTTNYPLLEALLEDDASRMSFQSLSPKLVYARKASMRVLEQLLSAHGMSDEEGAAWVLAKAKDKLIGDEDKASDSDYPMIARFCKANYQRMPLTCLMLMSHGHTRFGTDARVSQEVTPIYHDILKVLPASPAKFHSMVEYCAADHELEAWKDADCQHVLTLMGLANDCLNACADVEDERLTSDKESFEKLISLYTTKSKSLITLLSERISKYSAYAVMPDQRSKGSQDKIDREVNALFGLIRDYSDTHAVLGRSHTTFFGELNILIHEVMRNEHAGQYTGPAYDPVEVVSCVLKQFAKDPKCLANQFWRSATALFESDQILLGESIEHLSQQIRRYSNDPALMDKGFTGILITLSNWLGRCDIREPISSTFRDKAMGAFFEPECLTEALKGLEVDAPGLKLLSGYVMDKHPALRRKIPRAERGNHLSDTLGL
jgi:hypothetical protein